MRMRSHRRRLAAAIGATALAGGVFVAGITSAQTPPAGTPWADQQPPAADRQRHGRLAARLAQALGMPQADVEQGLRRTRKQLPENPRRQGRRNGGDRLTAIATQLGVTPEELGTAMRAARRSPAAPEARGPERGQRPDRQALFDAVAQQLGRGITGAQVRAAFESQRPSAANRPSREEIHAWADQFLQTLARELGVDVERLRDALRLLRPQGRLPGETHPRGR